MHVMRTRAIKMDSLFNSFFSDTDDSEKDHTALNESVQPKRLKYDEVDEQAPTSSEQQPVKRQRKVKTLSKKDRTEVVDSIKSIEMRSMMNEMETQLLKYVQEGEQISKEGVEILCNEGHIIQCESLVELHRTVFAFLYQKCGTGKKNTCPSKLNGISIAVHYSYLYTWVWKLYIWINRHSRK